MDQKAEKIKQKIAKLTQQLSKIEEKHEKTIAKLVKDTVKKGVEVRVLAGMLLNAESILKLNPKELETWQAAGEKFLLKSKGNPSSKKDNPTAK